METMKFHWELGEKSGSFTVTADSIEECVQLAEEETEKAGAELIDYYSVEETQGEGGR